MPEGPEVRVSADFMREKYEGWFLMDIEHTEAAKLKNEHLFVPGKILSITSYGKKVIFLTKKYSIVFSLGMTGSFRLEETSHSHITFKVKKSNIRLRGPGAPESNEASMNKFYFHDTRRFGLVAFYKETSLEDLLNGPLNDLGTDLLEAALNDPISSEDWTTIFAQRHSRGPRIGKKTIAEVLMDQSFVSGIGNYLKSEILYFSSILPQRIAAELSDKEWEKLRIEAHRIIKKSYLVNGHTIESFISPDGSMGSYEAVVYKKATDPLGHDVISGPTKDGRTSYWVEEVQR